MCTVKTSPTSAKKEAEGRVWEVWQGWEGRGGREGGCQRDLEKLNTRLGSYKIGNSISLHNIIQIQFDGEKKRPSLKM